MLDQANIAPMPMKTFAVLDPATLAALDRVADAGPPQARVAVDRAAEAQVAWARRSSRERSDVLRRAFELMVQNQEELADLISQENGKSAADARSEVLYAAEFFRWYSEEATRTDGAYGPAPSGGNRSIITHRPVGVAALVTPWNFPAAMVTRKLAPALAAGCSAVLKPAAETPLTALRIGALLTEAGTPDGVVEIVTTTDAAGVVATWLEDHRVRKLSFTGSTAVGRTLLRQCANSVMNASMELGGNAPFIVTPGADLDRAVAGAMVAKLRNGGQACTAANRFYIHTDIADEFTVKFCDAVSELTVGPARSGADIGPLISDHAVARITRSVDLAVSQGARIGFQSQLPTDLNGHFFPPTVLTDVPPDADILKEEIFGPVAPLVAWDDEQEMLRLANDSEFGLAAYVYSADRGNALRVAERLDAGMVGINRGVVSDPSAPFGGIKQSGLGREGARDGLREFQEVQYLSMDWPEDC